MHRLPAGCTAVLATFVLAAFTLAPPERLEIGDAAPMTDYAMRDVTGETYTLSEVAGEKGLLVIFSCNTCPWVKAWEDRYPKLDAQAEQQGIGLITVNPNAGYRDRGESMADMKARAEASNYTFPYVLDKDAQLAEAFGATRTPDVFLFDADMTLVYQGAIDDNARNADAVEHPYLSNAMTAMVQGNPISTPVTKAFGCTIKWPAD